MLKAIGSPKMWWRGGSEYIVDHKPGHLCPSSAKQSRVVLSKTIHFPGLPQTIMTNYNKLCVLKQQFWRRLEVWVQSISRTMLTLKTLKESLLNSFWFLGDSNPWPSLAYNCITPISTLAITWYSPCVSLFSYGYLLIRVLVILDWGPTLLQYLN